MDLVKVKHDVLGFVFVNQKDFDPAVHTLFEAPPAPPEKTPDSAPEMPPELPPDAAVEASEGEAEPPAKRTRKAAS